MDRPLYVIPAIGKHHAIMAELFVRSSVLFDWSADMLTLSAGPVTSTHPLGKDIKTVFGRFLPPDRKGPVVLCDADSLATGPMPVFSADAIQACPVLSGYDSFLVSFPTAGTAALFSDRWHSLWKAEGCPGSDVCSFNRALEAFGHRVTPTAPDLMHPHPSIMHLRLGKTFNRPSP
jgi:hypothetical protein